jgi:hypothetical protein
MVPAVAVVAVVALVVPQQEMARLVVQVFTKETICGQVVVVAGPVLEKQAMSVDEAVQDMPVVSLAPQCIMQLVVVVDGNRAR